MASPGFRSLCAFTQPDHGHQECRPALFSDFPAPSVPPPADGGWTWSFLLVPWSFLLVPFPLSMSSRYLWRRQKITLSLSDMRKPFMREICPACGREDICVVSALGGSSAPVASSEGQWCRLPSWGTASQDRWTPAGNVLKWCRIRQLWKQGSWSSASSTRNQNERKKERKVKVNQQCNHKGAYFLM